jgi:hypothetical protein
VDVQAGFVTRVAQNNYRPANRAQHTMTLLNGLTRQRTNVMGLDFANGGFVVNNHQ